MSVETFDDFLATNSQVSQNDKPFALRDEPGNDKKTLEWLNNNYNMLEQAAQSRLRTYRRYISLYKNVQWKNYDARDLRNDDGSQSERKPRVSVNFVEEMVEARVAQGAQTKIGFTMIPQNQEEQKDINNAKACKLLLQNRCDQIDFELIQQEADRIKFLMGTVVIHVCWDKKAGPLHPKYKKAEEKGVKIPKIDEKGKPIKGKYLEGKIRMGDVGLNVLGPDLVYPQHNKEKWEDIDHIDIIEWVHIEELKKMYPNKANEIKENAHRFYYDYDAGELGKPVHMVQVRHFYHKKTDFLPEGAYIKYTDDVILEEMELPYDDGELPIVIDRDIAVYREIWGRSFLSNIEQLQRMYNNIQSGIARDLGVGSAPKWMMPKGSVDVVALNNEFSVIQYTGPKAPELVSFKPVADQGLLVQDRLEKQISQKSTIYDISRGEVPQGVTANSALRFLDEQESRRAAPLISKRNRRILLTLRMMLMRMRQYYKVGDDRTIHIVGKQNEYLIKSFKEADFSQIWDIRLQKSSALPDTKTGKISTIVDLNTSTQTDPIFTREDIVEMLDLGADERFVSDATIAITAARTLLDMMLNGEAVPEPQVYDNHVVHYNVFLRELQSLTYRTHVSPQVKKAIETRIMVIEGLMFEKARTNQMFLQQLMMMPQYPIFYKLPMPLAQLGAMQAQAMGGPMGAPQSAGGVNLSPLAEKTKNLPGEVSNAE